MWWKLSFILVLTLLGPLWVGQAVDEDPAVTSEIKTQQKFTPEDECSRAGGICLARESCPPEKISQEGQCPTQSKAGAVCCHSLSITESRCKELGGHCIGTCSEALVIARAKDCPAEEKCCPLVV